MSLLKRDTKELTLVVRSYPVYQECMLIEESSPIFIPKKHTKCSYRRQQRNKK